MATKDIAVHSYTGSVVGWLRKNDSTYWLQWDRPYILDGHANTPLGTFPSDESAKEAAERLVDRNFSDGC